MSIDTTTLIWLFPIAFMFHDFEELILFEPWLKKNARDIEARLKPRVPAFIARQISTILVKSTTEFAIPVSLIFAMTGLASFLAVVLTIPFILIMHVVGDVVYKTAIKLLVR